MINAEATATIRPELAQVVQEFDTDYGLNMLIGERVLPAWETADAEAGFPVLRRGGMRKMPDTARAPGAGFPRGNWEWGKDTFDCIENAYEIPCDAKQARKYARFIDYLAESATIANFIVRMRHEQRVAAAVMNTTTFTAHNVAVAWATIATSTPLADVDTAAGTVEDALGVPRDQLSLILPRSGWQYLRNATTVLDNLKSWDSGIQRREAIKQSVVAQYLDVKEILIGRSSVDTAPEGIAESLSQVWSTRYGMLAKLASGPRVPLKTPCLGRTARWTDGMPSFVTLETYAEANIDSEVVRARQFTDEIIICDDAGYLLDLTAAT